MCLNNIPANLDKIMTVEKKKPKNLHNYSLLLTVQHTKRPGGWGMT